jgi:ATP adenylyltransferase
MQHVLGDAPRQQGCLFEPPGTERSNKTHLLLYRNDTTLVLLNRFPYNNGHLLVAPVRHVACLTELDDIEGAELMKMVQKSSAILKNTVKCDGLNIGCNINEIAGAGIADHLHFHLVPRWKDDHNFMTVIAEIRSIPEHIEITFDKLLPEFQLLDNRK